MIAQILLNSVLSGLLLCIVAIGFNLIFNATRVFHLAHGAIYVSSIYFFHQISQMLNHRIHEPILVFGLSLFLSFVFISVLAAIIEYSVYRPLYKKNANPIMSLVSSLGTYLFIISLITFFYGNESISLNTRYDIVVRNDWFKLTDVELVQMSVGVILISLIQIFAKTKGYANIRAITDSYSVAEKFGIDINKTRLMSLVIGSVLAGSAGILKAYEVAINPNVGLSVTLLASVAVILGGQKSLVGTIVACFMIAFIENFSVKFISARWEEALTYTLLMVVLVVYQRGLVSAKQRVDTA
jgi:branched-chain amino acid transport system permease protein